MQKILMLSRLFWPHAGGVERHVLELSKELLKRNYSVSVLTEQHDSTLPLDEEFQGIHIKRIPNHITQSKRGLWRYMAHQSTWIKSHQRVHIHDVFWWFAPRTFSQPFYITFHGYEGDKPPRWQAVVQRKLAERLARGSICVGDFMKKWYFASPTLITYGAAQIQPLPRVNGTIAVFYGRFAGDTGIMIYLDAVQLFKPPLQLAVYGSGPQESEVFEKIKSSSSIAVHEWQEDVRLLLKPARYAFVSRYLSILEAMQAKRLVVAVYNNQIKKDYLQCHPMARNMIIAESPEELYFTMSELTVAKELEMVESAYDWARRQNWVAMANTYEKLWSL